VDHETTGQRIVRLRRELDWTQEDLASASGVSVPTIYLVENDRPGKRGERASVSDLLNALESELSRRQGEGPQPPDSLLVEFLARRDLEDVRMRRLGKRRKVRYLSVVIPDPDATPADVAEAIEDLHRRRMEGDDPNG
jgi:transcriptional regulator with XRE-family HTH domain